jgi:hypothetical protein
MKRKTDELILPVKSIAAPTVVFDTTQGSRGYFTAFIKVRYEAMQKALLFLIDPSVPLPTGVSPLSTFRKSEAIIDAANAQYEYLLSNSNKEGRKIATTEAQLYFAENNLVASPEQFRQEVENRLEDGINHYLTVHHADEINPHNWNTSQFTPEQDEVFSNKMIGLLDCYYQVQATNEIRNIVNAVSKSNQPMLQKQTIFLQLLNQRFGASINAVGADVDLARYDFLGAIRKFNKTFIMNFKAKDLEDTASHFENLIPKGGSLDESVAEFKEALYINLVMIVVSTMGPINPNAPPPPDHFDINFSEIDANSWDEEDYSIMQKGFRVLIPHAQRVTRFKNFITRHPWDGFRNAVIDFNKAVSTLVVPSTISSLYTHYLMVAQTEWNIKISEALPVSSSSSASAASSTTASALVAQVATGSNQKPQGKQAKVAAGKGTYARPPRGQWQQYQQPQYPVQPPPYWQQMPPQANMAMQYPMQANMAMQASPWGPQPYWQQAPPAWGTPPSFQANAASTAPRTAKGKVPGKGLQGPRPATPCQTCVNMGITGDPTFHSTAHNDAIAERVLQRQQAAQQGQHK